ncbi:MAG TPA: site-specific DNA-methyltransferase [Candidatus Lokiarchaeia archaeon]
MVKQKNRQEKSTKTSSFGSSKRISHDASDFYSRRLYNDLKENKIEYRENKVPLKCLDKIFCKSSENMDELPDESVHLMVTSPPYGVGKDYDLNLDLKEYLTILSSVFKEVWRILVPGGRAAVNVANIGRKPYIPLHAYIIQLMHEIGFHMRGEIIWDKGASAGVSCAWGSFASASNPSLRDVHEYVLVFSKLTNKLKKGEKEDTINKENFIEWSKSIWSFPTASAKKIGHPAPFPEELPSRLIQFYTYKGDIVLDPFMGSGTTAIAALNLKRQFIGYEISPEYIDLANKRIQALKGQKIIEDFF